MRELKFLPVSTASFRDIIKGDFLYVDKTEVIYKLIEPAKGAYFLSRPRRFGKSLLISTLEELFQGNRELFQGLWIDSSDYAWERHPIIRIDFGLSRIQSESNMEQVLNYRLQRIANQHGIQLMGFDYQSNFEDLILQLSQEKQVVILIDEYDKPLLDNILDVDKATRIRDILRGFYAVVKGMESHIRMVFITGVSKFSKVSIFSELNHLTDLTLQTWFSTALGITETELRTDLAPHITSFAAKEKISEEELLAKIRYWYNGFRFTSSTDNVYNPFSTMQLLKAQQFSSYWFDSGTPIFLIKLMRQSGYDIQELDNLQVQEIAFSSYDVTNLAILPLLFQTGYLTITDYDAETQLYTLGYPNYEVESAFSAYLLDFFSYIQQGMSVRHLWQLIRALEACDLQQFFKVLKVFFANIDYQLHIKQEKYYQSIFYLIFKLMSLSIQAEVQTNDGRIDAVAEVDDHIYIFEFKLDKTAQAAVDQIQNKDYALKYALHSKPITKVGVNFDSDKGQIGQWKIADENE